MAVEQDQALIARAMAVMASIMSEIDRAGVAAALTDGALCYSRGEFGCREEQGVHNRGRMGVVGVLGLMVVTV
ncbi:MAG TPA: hypothetical protein VFV64_13350, partial [Permianibacter sp.]|nr:hypothetical protein [Permianibacter sp.]